MIAGADRRDAVALLVAAFPALRAGVTLYLVSDTSHLWEGWLDRVGRLHLAVDGGRPGEAAGALDAAAEGLGLRVLLESPGDVIPLPEGAEGRHRPATPPPGVDPAARLRHFDPYSVAFRCLARGDEPDYRTVLRYLEHGWIGTDEMDRLLQATLPRFTLETIAQDPAELRRKYRGLHQMWKAGRRE